MEEIELIRGEVHRVGGSSNQWLDRLIIAHKYINLKYQAPKQDPSRPLIDMIAGSIDDSHRKCVYEYVYRKIDESVLRARCFAKLAQHVPLGLRLPCPTRNMDRMSLNFSCGTSKFKLGQDCICYTDIESDTPPYIT